MSFLEHLYSILNVTALKMGAEFGNQMYHSDNIAVWHRLKSSFFILDSSDFQNMILQLFLLSPDCTQSPTSNRTAHNLQHQTELRTLNKRNDAPSLLKSRADKLCTVRLLLLYL
jgi:hypothetical protein